MVEVVNPEIRWKSGNFDEIAWGAINFIPFHETSITIFQDIAREVKQGAPREIVDA